MEGSSDRRSGAPYERRVDDRTDRDPDLEGHGLPSLEAIERRRWQLWLITGFFLVVVSAVVFVALGDGEVAEAVPDIPALRWGFLALAIAYLFYIGDQERLLRRFTRAFVAQDVRAAALESRVTDLTTLTKVGRLVSSSLTVDEVVGTILDAAFELTRARNGSVMLREGEELTVVASAGPDAVEPGARTSMGEGPAGEAAAGGRPLLLDGRTRDRGSDRDEGRDVGSSVVVPLVAADEVVGVLSLERATRDQPFSDLDVRSIALFAEHAGVAIGNAQRYEEERSTATRLADVLEIRSEFVAAMVHDLKSPLTAVVGFNDLLRGRWHELDEAHRERALAAIDRQTERLLTMIDEVLRSASVEAGAELTLEPVDLGELLRPLTDSVAAAATAREGVHRDVEVDLPDGGVTVGGDDEALRHIFTNLLENAVKYSPPGSPVDVQVERHDDHVEVHVSDRGVGIDEDELPHVFDRFRQVPGRRRGGVGLGLYIVRTLVSAHGGRVWVTSSVGEGSTFSVSIPVPEAAEAGDDADDASRPAAARDATEAVAGSVSPGGSVGAR